jgi:hypothetical protein
MDYKQLVFDVWVLCSSFRFMKRKSYVPTLDLCSVNPMSWLLLLKQISYVRTFATKQISYVYYYTEVDSQRYVAFCRSSKMLNCLPVLGRCYSGGMASKSWLKSTGQSRALNLGSFYSLRIPWAGPHLHLGSYGDRVMKVTHVSTNSGVIVGSGRPNRFPFLKQGSHLVGCLLASKAREHQLPQRGSLSQSQQGVPVLWNWLLCCLGLLSISFRVLYFLNTCSPKSYRAHVDDLWVILSVAVTWAGRPFHCYFM